MPQNFLAEGTWLDDVILFTCCCYDINSYKEKPMLDSYTWKVISNFLRSHVLPEFKEELGTYHDQKFIFEVLHADRLHFFDLATDVMIDYLHHKTRWFVALVLLTRQCLYLLVSLLAFLAVGGFVRAESHLALGAFAKHLQNLDPFKRLEN